MNDDFLYANPPLIEVIAEVRWRIQELSGTGNAIDPHYDVFSKDFIEASRKAGYSVSERLIPEQIPLEFLPYKVIQRIRREHASWPLAQIGPGLLTINIVPPYQGWSSFLPVVDEFTSRLFEVYPLSDTYLDINQVELRYIDGFTQAHGVVDHYEFLRDELGLVSEVPKRIAEHAIEGPDSILRTGTLGVFLKSPEQSIGSITFDRGEVSNRNAVIATFTVRSLPVGTPKDNSGILAWLSDAHNVTRDWFDTVTSDKVKDAMGPTTNI